MRKLLWAVAAIAVLAIVAGNASAGIIYFEEFGPNATGTGDLSSWDNPVTATSVADITAPGGGYALLANNGGEGAGSSFGLTSANDAAAYSSPYADSVTMYINPALVGSTPPATAFNVRINPADAAGDGAADWGNAQLFTFTTTGTGALTVGAGNTAYGADVFSVGTISTAGWYTFQIGLYQVSPYWSDSGNVAADFNVYNSLGDLISSMDDVNTGFLTSDLGGPGYNTYENIYGWDTTYSPDGLAIVGVAQETYSPSPVVGSSDSDFNLYPAVATPEPISMIFFGTGLAAVSGYMARRKMARKA